MTSTTSNIGINNASLISEYNKLLLDYNQSQKDIIDAITNNTSKLVSMGANTTLTGGSNLETINEVENVEDCKAKCSETTGCKGANFLGDTKTCTLFSGNNTITFDTNADNMAIITELQSKIYTSKGLNNRLQSINKQINDNLRKQLPETEQQMTLNNQSADVLHTQYNSLLLDRQVLSDQQSAINDISNQISNKEINVSQITGQYVVWTVFTVIVLSITIILYAVPDINILEKFPLLFLIVILLIAYFIYTYLQKIHITNPNVDMAYNINKINYFNY
jgi:3-keto-L-gulonate-6-phosphate decarboxylase